MERTRVAVLGTLSELHHAPISNDLGVLMRVVTTIRPNLLCLDMSPAQWRRRESDGLPTAYCDALLPHADQPDIVVVPVGGDDIPPAPWRPGWRGAGIRGMRRALVYLHTMTSHRSAVNTWICYRLGRLLYCGIGILAGRELRHAWADHTLYLTAQVRAVARRDPTRRVLVALNVRYYHHSRHKLQQYPEIQIVDYRQL